MYLKRLEIQGFKTFAGRSVLEFRPGITAVVGPNGSGKSNLADAVRWVLGEQSLATLRCKRSEELIYAGGGRRAPAGLVEVSLTIDNADRLLPLDFDEVTITRRATRAGDSEYFINRTRVRLRDLVEATEPLGGSYTIINQGLVDAALTLRPEERRRLFEDAAELGGFELRKAEATRRLRETEANLSRVGDLLAELEPRLRTLKRQASQARQHRELTTELQALQLRFYALQWRTAQLLTADTAAALARLEGELATARASQGATVAELAALRAALRARRDDLGQLHQQSGELHRRAETAQRELAVGSERAAALARRAEDLERQRNELALRRSQAEAQHAEAAAELARAQAELAERRQSLQQAEAARTGLEAARQALARELRQAQEVALRAATSVAEQQSRGEQLATQELRLAREGNELAASVAQAAQQLGAAQAQHAAASTQLAEAEAAYAAAAHAEQAARQRLEDLRAERTHADEERAVARRSLADAEARLESLSRLARSYAGTFAGVRAAMQWAERAGRPGFALVQSLIRTPAELETALEVALGSRLQNIVVEQWADAEQAIAELKRSGAGRATFMPLDTIRGQGRGDRGEGTGERELVTRSPEDAVLGLAAELVGFDPRYEAVVRQLLGRVLIVRDLAAARSELRRLSGGWTIVTLAGEQVNSGGSLTGGAQVKESGALRRERELRELPEQVAAARATVAAAEARRAALEAELQAQAAGLRELEGQARESRRRNESARAALDGAARRQAQAEQEQNWTTQRRERLEHERAALTEQRERTAAALAAATQVAAQAELALTELRTHQEHEAQADRVAQEQLSSLRAAVGAAEGQLRAGRGLLSAHEQTLAMLAQQEQQVAQVVAAGLAERAALAADHARVEALHHSLLSEIDALRARIAPAEAALHADETHQAALEAHEEQATAALLAAEAAHGRAALEAQRATDRQEALFERAAADGIDVTAPDQASQPGADPTLPANASAEPSAFSPQPGADPTLPANASAEPSAFSLQPSAFSLQPDADPTLPVNASAEPSAFSLQPSAFGEAIEALKAKILRLGAVNPLALEEYEASAERQRFLSTQVEDLREAGATLLELIGELDTAMHSRFVATFHAVAAEFEQSFTRLFGGGSARLVLTGGTQPDEGEGAVNKQPGVEIIARPPGKKQQSIALLSGGERSLTAVALLFAILKVNPSPFCILDETDAALDESNVGRFGAALGQLTKQTQFILITHNRGTIEAADTLYGVTMGDDGASKLMSLRVEEYVSAATE